MDTLNEHSIGMSSLYCKALGIEENKLVLLSEIPSVPTINSITILPASGNDYDVIVSVYYLQILLVIYKFLGVTSWKYTINIVKSITSSLFRSEMCDMDWE